MAPGYPKPRPRTWLAPRLVSDEHVSNYAAFVSRCVQSDGLYHFDRSAIARIVEHGSRLREHQSKLSTRLRDIADVVSEASFWAARAGRDIVAAEDVDRAVAKREYRSNLFEERMHELIGEGTIAIDTTGERTAQVTRCRSSTWATTASAGPRG